MRITKSQWPRCFGQAAELYESKVFYLHHKFTIETFSSQNDMSKLRVKFLIDKEQQRVIFAEAGYDFVDVLLSFLTLPLGRIVRLLGKKSGLPSLDSLYESVEMLDENCLQTEVCKEMLLNPRSAAVLICEDLKIKNIHHSNPRDFYFCDSKECFYRTVHYFTFVRNIRCTRCGGLITKKDSLPKNTSQKGGIFIKETINFLVTDNLRVIPYSLTEGFSILKEMGIKDTSMLEERVIDFGTEEALNILRKSLASKNPLTEVCFPDAYVEASVNCSSAIKEKLTVHDTVNENTFKLFLNKKKNNVMYAEVGERFVIVLLSFLTFPLGSVLGLLSDNISELSGCINNLYSSVENLSLDYFQSEDYKNMLLTPKLATFYRFEQQILNLEEISSQKFSVPKCCEWCYFNYSPKLAFTSCRHELENSILIEKNPKPGKVVTSYGGIYVFNTRRFMVADNLHVSPLSIISAITTDMNLSISDIVEKDFCLDKAKALSLLSAMLITSNTALTDISCPKPMQIRRFK